MRRFLTGDWMMMRPRLVLLIILTLSALIRLVFVFETPAWHAPDEYAHFWVVEQIAHEGAMPLSTPTWPAFESFQPPLYYFLASPLLNLFSEKVSFSLPPRPPPLPLIVLRLFSVLLAVATIWVSYRIILLIPMLEPGVALWCAAVMGFLPSFVASGASVSNDALVVFLSAVCLYCCWQPKWTDRTAFWVGLWAGLAVLTKMNGLVMFPIVALRAWQTSDYDPRLTTRRLVLMASGAAIPISLLLVRNVILYDDWLALDPGVEKGCGLTLPNTLRAVRNLTWSFWLAFGRGYKVSLHPVVYVITALPLMLLAAAGWVRDFGKKSWLLAPVGLAILSAIAGSLLYTSSYPPGTATSWGKNLFPVLPMIVLFLIVGWRSLWPSRPGLLPAVSTVLMFSGCSWALWQLSGLVG